MSKHPQLSFVRPDALTAEAKADANPDANPDPTLDTQVRVLIQTPTSRLTERYIGRGKLVRECVDYVCDKLEHDIQITMFNRPCTMARGIGFFSNESAGYTFSNQIIRAQPLERELSELTDIVNDAYGANFNAVLVNYYENGSNSLSEHSDADAFLGNVGVVAVSFGAERTFRVRDKVSKKIVGNFKTKSSHALHMEGNFQKEFKHGIPAEKRIADSRMSFTFRHHTR